MSKILPFGFVAWNLTSPLRGFGSQGPYYGGGGFMKNSPGGFGTQATPGGDGGNQ
ncbi:hypothetical protein FRC16_003752, partial [Serendipita sp. 398]